MSFRLAWRVIPWPSYKCPQWKQIILFLDNAIPVLGMKLKRGWSVCFNINLCWVPSMERSRRDLSNDMAEHRPNLKKKTLKYVPPPFWFHTHNRYSISQNGVWFLLCDTKTACKTIEYRIAVIISKLVIGMLSKNALIKKNLHCS